MAIAGILGEAAAWLISRGELLWELEEVSEVAILPEVLRGWFWMAKVAGEPAGCVRYQRSDKQFWDDIEHDDSAFVHRLAVKRAYSGRGLSEHILEWAKSKASAEGKRFLRLDCADRPKLRAVYERAGFVFHSIKEREPFAVARYQFDLTDFTDSYEPDSVF